MEIQDDVPVPNHTRGIEGYNPEYYKANEVYEISVSSSVWLSAEEYRRDRILSRFQHINYSKCIKEEEYRKFVSKREVKDDKQGFRIWRIQ